MAKEHKPDISPAPKAEPMPQTGCIVCGSYAGSLETVTPNARVHAACGQARPDIIAKAKARA